MLKKQELRAINVNPTKLTVKTLLRENPIYRKNQKNPLSENTIGK